MSTAGELSCDNCGEGHGPDDIFCENCGYDFITGSLPSPDERIPGAVLPDAGLTPLDEPTPLPAQAPAAGAPLQASGAPAETEQSEPVQGEAPSEASTAFLGSESPATVESPAAAPHTGSASGTGAGAEVPMPTKLRISITPDRAYFDAVVSEGELEYPEPPPTGLEIDVNGIEFHVGRTSQSRAIHPDLDIADLTGDPAVSSRHAVIRVAADGSLSVTDVGSTNGTFVGDVSSNAIKVGEVMAVDDATPIFLGAWTRLEITKLES